MKLYFILFALPWLLRIQAWRYADFAKRLKEKNIIVQMKIADDSKGRFFSFNNGRIISTNGIHPNPDMCISFKSVAIATVLLTPPINYQAQIDAIKNFNLIAKGPDELVTWFSETIMMSQTIGWEFGTSVGNGETRYVNNTNGGPVYVYVSLGSYIVASTRLL